MFSKVKSSVTKTFPWLPRVLSSNETYWKKRTQQYGRRAVLNLGHSEDEFDALTQKQLDLYLPILKEALDGSEKILLDYGCGPGRFTKSLADLISGQAIGIDISKELISLAPAANNATYIAMPRGEIPRDMAFDVVWVCLVLGGIPDKHLSKVANMLESSIKPGGLLFLVENTSNKPSGNYWHFRNAGEYTSFFSSISLRLATVYDDLGEEISVMVGRKVAC